MDGNLNIVICRHPERVHDQITPNGALQAVSLARWLVNQNYEPTTIFHSGVNRTRETAFIMAAATDMFSLQPEKDEEFNFMHVVHEYMKGSLDCLAENNEQIAGDGGTVRAARQHSSYARRVYDHLRLKLEQLARHMSATRQKNIWVISHGQFAEALAPKEIWGKIPWGIDYCDTLVYCYRLEGEEHQLVDAEYIPYSQVIAGE